MITFKEYLAEIAIKGKAVKAKKKVTEAELRELVKNRDVEGLENADVSKITNMKELFENTNLGSPEFNPDISDWDTSNVTNMKFMCLMCTSLEEAPKFDTSKVTDMYAMFRSCASLEKAPNLDTSNVINMTYMFTNCTSLTKGDMSNWDVSKVEYKSSVFANCPFPDDKKPKFKD